MSMFSSLAGSMKMLPGQGGKPAAGGARAAQAPRLNQPAQPGIKSLAVGRPPGAPGTNGWKGKLGASVGKMGAALKGAGSWGTGKFNPGAEAAKAVAGNPAAMSGAMQKAQGTGANRNPEALKAAQGFLKAGAEMTSDQRSSMGKMLGATDIPTRTPTAMPGDGAPMAQAGGNPADPTTTTTMPGGGASPPAAPALPGGQPRQPKPYPGADAGIAPAAGAAPVATGGTTEQGGQPAAAPIATPETAASQPLKKSPWAYEKKWGALGALGDTDVDSAVKKATLEGMQSNPYDEQARGVEKGRIFEEGMAGAKGAEEAMKADLARRGITGPAAAQMIAEGNMAARSNISQQQRKSVLEMTDKEATHKLQSTAQGQALSAELAKRGVDIETLRMNREQLATQIAQAKRSGRGGGGGENMIELMNPDGTTSQVPMDMLMMTMDLMEGGYE